MKKTIFITIAITIVSFLILLAIVFGALMFFAPLSLATLSKNVGNDNMAIYFYEVQYGKTGDINDLKTLLYQVNAEKNYTLSAKYSKIMVEDGGFAALSRSEDEADKTGLKFADYVYGNYAVALYETGAEAEEIFALDTYEDYRKDNIYQFLLDDDKVKQDGEFLVKIKEKLEEFEQNEILQKDKDYIEILLR